MMEPGGIEDREVWAETARSRVRPVRYAVCLALCAFVSVLLGLPATDPALADTPAWTFTDIDARGDRASQPSIDHENGVTRVVWHEEDPATGESHIYLYDSSQALGGTVVCVDQYASAGLKLNVLPDCHDGVVVWMGRASQTDTYDIYAYYLDDRYFGSGKTLVRITDNTLEDSSPRTDNGKVIWQQDDGNDSEILLWHRTEPPGGLDMAFEVKLTNNSVDDFDPDIYTFDPGTPSAGTGVVYTHYGDGSDGDIYEWYASSDYPASADSGQVKALSSNDSSEGIPRLGEQGACWALYDGHDWEIYWRNLVTAAGATERLTDNDEDDDYPDIDGGAIVWAYFPAELGGVRAWIKQYDVDSGLTTTVSDTAHPAYGPPTISEGRVAFEFSVNSRLNSDVCIAAPAETPGTPSFSDIAGNPYADFITEMANRGIINGYPDGTFRPNSPVLRKHFAKMIVGTVLPSVSEDDWQDSNPPFIDCGPDDPADTYPHDYIAAAKTNGLTQGKTATTFAPDANITRAQLITMVVRAAQNQLIPLAAVDANYAGFFRDYGDPNHGANVKLAEYNGLLEGLVITGTPSSWLAGNATRGEVALVLVRLLLSFPHGSDPVDLS